MLKMLKSNWKRSIFKNDEIKSDLLDKTVDFLYAPPTPIINYDLDLLFLFQNNSALFFSIMFNICCHFL